MLRLTRLAPAMVEATMDGRQPKWMTLSALMRQFRMSGRSNKSGAMLKSHLDSRMSGRVPTLPNSEGASLTNSRRRSVKRWLQSTLLLSGWDSTREISIADGPLGPPYSTAPRYLTGEGGSYRREGYPCA
jgi:hypothetical protein